MRTRISLTLAAVGLVTACGGSAADQPATDSAAAAAAPAATVAATPAVLHIDATDFAYASPDTITAGMVTMHLVNKGPSIHHVQVLRLDDGHTVAELIEGMKSMKPGSPPPPWVHDVAGPNSPNPGGESSLTQDLPAGNYALVCFIPTPDGVPHVMKGMIKGLTVVPAAAGTTPAPAPVADITVKMKDYAWDVSPEITAGKHIIKIENDAAQSHEMFLARLAPGKVPLDLVKWTEKQQGPPPGDAIGGISGMSKGQVVYLPVDLTPGEYGLFCFLPDAKDGKTHIEHGMIKQISVK